MLNYDEMRNSSYGAVFQVGSAVVNESEEVYFQIERTIEGLEWQAGFVTNTGLHVTDTMLHDNCFSIDENLQAFYEMLGEGGSYE